MRGWETFFRSGHFVGSAMDGDEVGDGEPTKKNPKHSGMRGAQRAVVGREGSLCWTSILGSCATVGLRLELCSTMSVVVVAGVLECG